MPDSTLASGGVMFGKDRTKQHVMPLFACGLLAVFGFQIAHDGRPKNVLKCDPSSCCNEQSGESVVKLLENPLLNAARAGDVLEVQRLVGTGVDVKAKDADGNTALHWASQSGNVRSMKILLAAGADVNAKNVGLATPLMYGSHKAVSVRTLVDAGADIHAVDEEGRNALLDAARETPAEQPVFESAGGPDRKLPAPARTAPPQLLCRY